MSVVQTDRPSAKSDAIRKAASSLIAANTAPDVHVSGTGQLPVPIISKGKGAMVTDVDGNEYITYVHGALILGHADERIVVAITKAVSKGCDTDAPTDTHVRLAELVVSGFASIEMLFFVDSFHEAVVMAAGLARVHTNRPNVVVFAGCGHDFATSRLEHRGTLDSAPFTLPYNDVQASQSLFARCSGSIAGVLIEPITTRGGLTLPCDHFLPTLRSLCDEHGALLIFDETVTGLRVPPDRGTKAFEVVPDLTLLGGVLGGGLPLAAVGGRRDVMRRMSTGTSLSDRESSCGHQLAAAAGIAMLHACGEPGFHEMLEAKSARLDDGLQRVAANVGVPIRHHRIQSLLGSLFTRPSSTSVGKLPTADGEFYACYYRHMLDGGVQLPSSALGTMFVSAAHTDEQIDRTIAAAEDALRAAVAETGLPA